MKVRGSVLLAAVALVLGATGCGATKTATETADDAIAVERSEPGGELLPWAAG